MKYTVIIPTMWKGLAFLFRMLEKYQANDLVGEILLVNNAPAPFDLDLLAVYGKVVLLNDGTNLFVNPSWNLGVEKSKYDAIVLANDDIFIEEFDRVMELVNQNLHSGQIIGFEKVCFSNKRGKNQLPAQGVFPAIQWTLTYGFGAFMALLKSAYLPVVGPMKVWYGDMYLYAQLKPYHLRGVNIDTPMMTTTKTMDLVDVQRIEHNYYMEHVNLFTKSL